MYFFICKKEIKDFFLCYSLAILTLKVRWHIHYIQMIYYITRIESLRAYRKMEAKIRADKLLVIKSLWQYSAVMITTFLYSNYTRKVWNSIKIWSFTHIVWRSKLNKIFFHRTRRWIFQVKHSWKYFFKNWFNLYIMTNCRSLHYVSMSESVEYWTI